MKLQKLLRDVILTGKTIEDGSDPLGSGTVYQKRVLLPQISGLDWPKGASSCVKRRPGFVWRWSGRIVSADEQRGSLISRASVNNH
jgi:hypothetical protein